ncbi:hypothetical protein [Mycobacterium paraterrae]|uniref:PE-PGRS family protein n=1 Tax=Mycobacterium paraterrae TaxID=577492 RepID=A0ABY3VKR4_9MYCO|nr:hypothetical protein [Mycobacterium paraterrae]UMB70000.1 hypothetical protein MKK62_01165 [Mycobacterium paraterrae]
MDRTIRRTAAVAVATLIASPALALCAASVASADGDLASIGPITIDGYTASITYDTASGAFDDYLAAPVGGYPADLDLYYDPAGSGNGEVLLTIPFLFQGGFEDVDGTITPFSSVNPADFVNPDIGLINLGGTPDPALGVVSFGPFLLGGYEDTFSINSTSFAIDNYVTGVSNSLPFDLDFFTGAPGSNTSEFLLTVPLLFQVGLEDLNGAITPIFEFGSVLDPDLGLSAIAGL